MTDERDVQAAREWIFSEFSHDPWCATLREGAQCHCWLALKPQALAAEYARVRAETATDRDRLLRALREIAENHAEGISGESVDARLAGRKIPLVGTGKCWRCGVPFPCPTLEMAQRALAQPAPQQEEKP